MFPFKMSLLCHVTFPFPMHLDWKDTQWWSLWSFDVKLQESRFREHACTGGSRLIRINRTEYVKILRILANFELSCRIREQRLRCGFGNTWPISTEARLDKAGPTCSRKGKSDEIAAGLRFWTRGNFLAGKDPSQDSFSRIPCNMTEKECW